MEEKNEMGQYKDDFYNKLKNDYRLEGRNSFIYHYIKNEKEKNIRIQLKKRNSELKDEKASKEEYVEFLTESLLEDGKLRKGYSELENVVTMITLGLKLEKEESQQVLEEVRKETKTAGKKTALNKQIKSWLKELKARLATKKGKAEFPEVPLSLLNQVTNEILKVYEKGDKTSESGERKDSYVELMLVYLEFRKGTIKESEYMIWILQMLQSNSKLRLPESWTEWVLEFGRKMGGSSVYKGLRNHNAKYGKVCELLQSGKSLTIDKNDAIRDEMAGIKKEMSVGKNDDILAGMVGIKKEMSKDKNDAIRAGLVGITEELQERMINMDITTFFYDAGYPLRAKEEDSDSRFRKKDRTMDLLDFYCEKNHIAFGGRKAVPDVRETLFSEENYEDYETMYRILNQGQREDVMVPVMIDNTTGAGIYILGRDYYIDSPEYGEMIDEKPERYCCYGILEPFDAIERTIQFEVNNEPKCNFPNIYEAVFWFKERIREESYFEPYQNCNGKIPKDCPSIFQAYFLCEDEDLEADEKVTPLEKEMSLKELNKQQKLYEKEKIEERRKKEQNQRTKI